MINFTLLLYKYFYYLYYFFLSIYILKVNIYNIIIDKELENRGLAISNST